MYPNNNYLGLAWHAALKMTGVELELFTDIDMHQMIETGIRYVHI